MDYSLLLIPVILLGIAKIALDSYENIREGRYSLDYIAFIAMVLSLFAGEYLAGAIIAVMFMGGEALESYASGRAQKALKKLSETIPKSCVVVENGISVERPIQEVTNGSIILVKRNEIVPLDGVVVSKGTAIFDLSNLTGEVNPVEFQPQTLVKSGSINQGDTIELEVAGDFSTSTYHRIVELVENAKANPAPMVRLSSRANLYFTLATFVVVGMTYVLTHDLARVLAVLVIATPCPLIIAAPVAFVGGLSRAAREGIIVRKPSAFEGIERATMVLFDKTGTLTLGEPTLDSAELSDEILKIAAGLEIHSLHPLAKSVVAEARRRGLSFAFATEVKEEIGKGISGTIGNKRYAFEGRVLLCDGVPLVELHFKDVIKDGVHGLLANLRERGVDTSIITGDTHENAMRVFSDIEIPIHAEQSPEDKHRLVDEAQRGGRSVVMVGDGLNDAPALARANVGIVFSGTENGAAIEAADVAILGSGLSKLQTLFGISDHTIRIAKQSIYGGIALSLVGMSVAAFGYIPPVVGAFIQEAIDVVVILNALRTLGYRTES